MLWFDPRRIKDFKFSKKNFFFHKKERPYAEGDAARPQDKTQAERPG
jgi:hypothetical protein